MGRQHNARQDNRVHVKMYLINSLHSTFKTKLLLHYKMIISRKINCHEATRTNEFKIITVYHVQNAYVKLYAQDELINMIKSSTQAKLQSFTAHTRY